MNSAQLQRNWAQSNRNDRRIFCNFLPVIGYLNLCKHKLPHVHENGLISCEAVYAGLKPNCLA